ncbi:MAG: LysM peptidoglycan-binding domain-containing protein [Sphingomonas sp.]
MRPVSPDARRVEAGTYTVRGGDSLRLIAIRTGAGSEAIARANGLAPPFTIRPGQQLRIPAGLYHVVREGETGIAIAQAYHVDWGRMVTINELEEPYIARRHARADPRRRPRDARAARRALPHRHRRHRHRRPARARRQGQAGAAHRLLGAGAALERGGGDAGAAGGQFPLAGGGNVIKRFGPGGTGERSDGIKIAVPLDTPVLAAADGVVAYVGSDVPALGGLGDPAPRRRLDHGLRPCRPIARPARPGGEEGPR